MRRWLPIVLVVGAGCSGLPPESIVPLEKGDTGAGLVVTVDLNSGYLRDLSTWMAWGLGDGVDIAMSFDALIVATDLLEVPFGGRGPAGPPGLSIRKTFDSGLGIGLATSSRGVAYASSGPSLMVGPFVTYAPSMDGPVVGRLTTYFGYAVVPQRADSTGFPTQRGLAVQAVGQLGPAFRVDSTTVAPGARVTIGYWLRSRPARMAGTSVGGTLFFFDPPESSNDD